MKEQNRNIEKGCKNNKRKEDVERHLNKEREADLIILYCHGSR